MSTPPATRLLALAVLLALVGCNKAPEPATPPKSAAARPAAVEWVRPAAVSEVDAAFARAQAASQPVFLFWTATWCPPCNQVKSTIFTRPEFIAKSRAFVPIYVDADSPSGQALGERYRVRGYPTMVLLDGSGRELTRLAGSVDPVKYMQLLDRGMAGGNSARQALDAALGGQKLPAEDWHMLAFYSWGTDDSQLVPDKDAAATLLKLAAACPAEQREASSRLVLQALLTASQDKQAAPRIDRADALASVRSLLAQPQLVRDNADILGYGADDIVGVVTAPGTKERAELVTEWNSVLDRLAADATLSNGARMYAVLGKVALARLGNKDGALPPALLEMVRTETNRVDREVTSIDERQAVITTAGYVLAQAGLLDESDALLQAELKRSHSPYYYMSQLASNAKKRATPEGKAQAVDWSRQAFENAQGSATRLRWGGSYINALVELTPQDAPAIEQATLRVLGELKAGNVALTGNNRLALERLSKGLVAWNKDGRHDAMLARLHQSVADICAPAAAAERAWCDGLFAPGKRV
jgi:thiol-disulfide isomerase/thioredoxin